MLVSQNRLANSNWPFFPPFLIVTSCRFFSNMKYFSVSFLYITIIYKDFEDESVITIKVYMSKL